MGPKIGHQPGINATDRYWEDRFNIDPGFKESTNPLWSHYGKMAKEDDKDTLEDMSSGMEGLLLFVRSPSTLPSLRSPLY